jgi:7tm Chemosensory receptor
MLVLQLNWSVNQLFGFQTIRFGIDTGVIVTNRGHAVYTSFVALLMTISYPISVYYQDIYISDPNSTVVLMWSLILDYFLYYIAAVSCLYTCALNRMGIQRVLTSLKVVYRCLEKFGSVPIDLRSVTKYVWMKFINQCMYTLIGLTFRGDRTALWLTLLSTEYIIGCAVTNTLVVLSFLTAYLKCLHAAVEKSMKMSQPSQTRHVKICDELEAVMTVYEEVVEIGDRFTRIFSVQLFCLLSSGFMLLFLQVSLKLRFPANFNDFLTCLVVV